MKSLNTLREIFEWLMIVVFIVALAILPAKCTEVPPSLQENVRFVNLGVKGDNSRFLEAMVLAANRLGVSDKKPPLILVVQTDPATAKWLGIEKRIRAVRYDDVTTGTYFEVWVDGAADDFVWASIAIDILIKNFSLEIAPEIRKSTTEQIFREMAATLAVPEKK